MRIRIKYFGWIAEQVNKREEDLELDLNSLNELKDYLKNKNQFQEDSSIRYAVNQELVDDAKLQDNDLVALLPPFAGG
ncbi:MAG: MoaD/ThiS family protein [Bacteroidetes bacterium]|nr:MoaD/ThiS family protein [Bacteroidota bacterium]